ncbi:MAG: hypothetical protein R3185_02705 [Candidatus Thermoplasmatota archaeon]|nr:hypothetical protein [Candidatus Thermoplasmatota archaeon]
MAEERVYEVFARKGPEDPLRHVGSVNAVSGALAETYARALYAEDASYAEMAVVPRDAMLIIEKPRPR